MAALLLAERLSEHFPQTYALRSPFVHHHFILGPCQGLGVGWKGLKLTGVRIPQELYSHPQLT